ncbi:hypothetical protein [Nocardioides massiliensis]|uniref:DUF2238 domain-containing protein n=1 Tax=Nocardioides massiliensis TaxID=1325935 RepID=A0ABT9NRJ7_9ACTN|nr:hypothetical protein [Nocardioides massiliensis]MDP9823043.1 hypothetical protein [Nocardioides massiliensis]
MVLIASDLVRAAAVVSLVVGTVVYGWVGAALFFLVLGGTFVPRAVGARQWLDALYCATLIFGAWAAQLDWYLAVEWLDIAVHAAATGLIAAVAWRLLEVLGGVGDAPTSVTVIVTASMATALAAVWEILEWAGNRWIDSRIQVGYDDTVGDLAAGVAGAVVAGVVISLARRRERVDR